MLVQVCMSSIMTIITQYNTVCTYCTIIYLYIGCLHKWLSIQRKSLFKVCCLLREGRRKLNNYPKKEILQTDLFKNPLLKHLFGICQTRTKYSELLRLKHCFSMSRMRQTVQPNANCIFIFEKSAKSLLTPEVCLDECYFDGQLSVFADILWKYGPDSLLLRS